MNDTIEAVQLHRSVVQLATRDVRIHSKLTMAQFVSMEDDETTMMEWPRGKIEMCGSELTIVFPISYEL